MDFHAVEANLRESFRRLAVARPRGGVAEHPGITIASLGARFQMFNAAFLNAPASTSDFEQHLDETAEYFQSRGLAWALWVCEDWMDRPLRRHVCQICHRHGLRLSSEMPGMAAERIDRVSRTLPHMEYRTLDQPGALRDFRAIGAVCFHVPLDWFSEVFDERMAADRPGFRCWVGYQDGIPMATAATVLADGVLGLYNVATAPEHRGRGVGEAITRHAISQSLEESDRAGVVLQSTGRGLPLYERLGFAAVTRILVFVSAR